MRSSRPKPLILAILDGWGVAPPGDGNAITLAKTPNFTNLVKTYPALTLTASGIEVGVKWGEMGNSEVGHTNIGAGRVYYQSLPRIDREIETGDFFKNEALVGACEHARKHDATLHIIGIVSNGNVHGSLDHVVALTKLAKKQKVRRVAIHAILDGRDAKFDSAASFIPELEKKIKKQGVGFVASLVGRYFAMDRDMRWDRVQKAYRLFTQGAGESAPNPEDAIKASYKDKVYDEEFKPTVIADDGRPRAVVGENDAIIFSNFRTDRVREITSAFVDPKFKGFKREMVKGICVVTMTEYIKDLPALVAYPPDVVKDSFAELISREGLKQLHVAETEKYAHVTFFFNGTIEEPFPGEDRVLVPSPHVPSYAEKPEMSAPAITKAVLKAIDEGKYDVIVVNYANADMVAHTGNLKATIRGVETIDDGLGAITKSVLSHGGVLVITADHGNAEELANLQTGQIDKEHSVNPVPLIIVGKEWEGKNIGLPEPVGGDLSLVPPVGILADVAPTVLKILGLKPSKLMTGHSLI